MNDLGMVLDCGPKNNHSFLSHSTILEQFFTARCENQDGPRKSPLRKGH